jgi:hypothetical protein
VPPTTTKPASQVSVHVFVVVLETLCDEPVWHVVGDQKASFLLQPNAAIVTDGRMPDHVPFASVALGQTWAEARAQSSRLSTARGPRMPGPAQRATLLD